MSRKLKKRVKVYLALSILTLGTSLIYRQDDKDTKQIYIHQKEDTLKTLKDWQKINPEIFALLKFTIDDKITSIPIIYTDNGDYYMLHDPWGNYDTMGSCFMEKQLSPLETSNNYIINGHSSKTKDWNFTFLKNYADKAYFDKHQEFKLIDEDGEHIYQIISFCEYDLDNPDTYLDWHNNYYANYEQVKTMFDNTLNYAINHIDGFYYHNQQLITLVTCNMQKNNARFVLQAYERIF